MRLCRTHRYAANRLQAFGIGEGNPGYSCPVPARVDADNEFSGPGVVVEFMVECLYDPHGFGMIQVGIQYPETIGKFSRKPQVSVEVNHFFRKGLSGAHGV